MDNTAYSATVLLRNRKCLSNQVGTLYSSVYTCLFYFFSSWLEHIDTNGFMQNVTVRCINSYEFQNNLCIQFYVKNKLLFTSWFYSLKLGSCLHIYTLTTPITSEDTDVQSPVNFFVFIDLIKQNAYLYS